MKVVGLTGGIATGKSTVGRRLVALGWPVIDADQVAREVVAPGEPALKKLVSLMGDDILALDGALDRDAMRVRMASDPQARRQLESVTHPAIVGRILERLQELAAAGTPIAVVDAALMVETGSYRDYPELIVVTCEEATQLSRLMVRDGMDEAAARRLIATQLPLAAKEAVATHVIRNDADTAALMRRVDEVAEAIAGKP